ncbi:MAG TPA: helix-turn-helix domain-containing protein, partial [Agromyces sp.]
MSASPRTARGVETRRRLLAAAERVFADHGYHEASVSRITDRAGVGQGTFYLYFDSKL